jgi:uncharacterized OsmC-like protein
MKEHQIELKYEGNLRVSSIHLQSGDAIITDAPTDNNGKGEAFSPTDTVASALGSCILTIMGIEAEKNGININGTKVKATKIMGTNPRRITEIHLEFIFNKSFTTQEKELLEFQATCCPVCNSLHPDIKRVVKFSYVV